MAAAALYREALGFWWVHDDFFHLGWVLDRPAASYLADPESWRRLPHRMLIPGLFASMELDLALWGPRAERFLAHQLAALAAAAATAYGLLRLDVARGWAVAGAALFVLGRPVAWLASHVGMRHYLEGLALALVAAALYRVALGREGRWAGGWSAASGLAYLGACLAKEVFVPLALLLPLVPVGRWPLRLRLALPHAAALVLYLGYRGWMLGTLVGGYGWTLEPAGVPAAALALPARVAGELADGSLAGAVLLAALLAGALALAWRRPATIPLLAAGALVALAPVLPVSGEMAPRYATVAWAGLALAFVHGAAGLARRGRGGRGAAAALVAVAAVGALSVHRTAWAEVRQERVRLAAENRALVELGPRDLVRHPAEEPAALAALRSFRARVLGRAEGAGWFADDLFVCLGGTEDRRVWAWDRERREARDVTAALPGIRRRHCASLRRDVPLEATLRHEDGRVRWRLGPYRDGRWTFVFDDGVDAVEVPAAGGYRLFRRAPLVLRVRYDAPAGWTTYSPPLRVELDRPHRARWRRTADEAPAP